MEDAGDVGVAVRVDHVVHEVVGDAGAQGRFAFDRAVGLVGAFERLDDLHRVRQDVPAGEDLMERLGELLGHVGHVRRL